MMKIKSYTIIPLIVIIAVFLAAYGLFKISKLRNFQFFGTLVSHVSTDEKIVALTFDDAPTEYTTEVLNILREKQIKATFFMIGREIEKYPSIAQAIVTEGHQMGNHSYSHKRMILKSPSFVATEIEKTNQLIRESGYEGEIFFRPPTGKKLFVVPWYLSQHGIKTIMWDVEPDTYGTTSDFIERYTVDHVKPGSIILIHAFCESCGGDRQALPRIIDELQRRGYQFVTVSNLLQ